MRPPDDRPGDPAPSDAERAVRAYRALVAHLGVPDTDLLRESAPDSTSGKPFAYVWPFEEAVKATLYLAGLPGIGG
jgi:hypothetical protein